MIIVLLVIPLLPTRSVEYKASTFSKTKKEKLITAKNTSILRHVVSNTNVIVGPFDLNFSHEQFIILNEEIKVIKKLVLKQKEMFLF